MTDGSFRDLATMLAGLDPWLDPDCYRFVTGPEIAAGAIATCREEEGWSSIVADPHGDMRRIVLQVSSSLVGVGLTVAVASTLADRGIACNMVAAYHHDHLFVPTTDAERALTLLDALQRSSRTAAETAA